MEPLGSKRKYDKRYTRIYGSVTFDNLCFLGCTPKPLLGHYSGMRRDFLLMDSGFYDIPNASAEAMAVGLLCIFTDCKASPRDLIGNDESQLLDLIKSL